MLFDNVVNVEEVLLVLYSRMNQEQQLVVAMFSLLRYHTRLNAVYSRHLIWVKEFN